MDRQDGCMELELVLRSVKNPNRTFERCAKQFGGTLCDAIREGCEQKLPHTDVPEQCFADFVAGRFAQRIKQRIDDLDKAFKQGVN